MTKANTSLRTALTLTIAISGALSLAACGGNKKPVSEIGGQFWQRTSASDALYIQGPKAQQLLNRDISRCVIQIRELESMGELRNAIPTDANGHVLTSEEIEVLDWDAPERDGKLFSEHTDFTDFEGCMRESGWERIEHVPYKVAKKGREEYLLNHVNRDHYVKEYDINTSAAQSLNE